jgi:hypothetical protein
MFVSRCIVCFQPLDPDFELVTIPLMFIDAASPEAQFHDATIHRQCLLASEAGRRCSRFLERYLECSRSAACPVCSQPTRRTIANPGNAEFRIEVICVDEDHPASEFNFLGIHRRCYLDWERRSDFERVLSAYVQRRGYVGATIQFDPLPRWA